VCNNILQPPEDKIKELGLDLSDPPVPAANFVPAVTTGNIVYLSGTPPYKLGVKDQMVIGKVGVDLNVEEATEAARLCAIALLAQLKRHIGSLNKVKRIVKLFGFVNCTPDFKDQSKVINGASDFLFSIFGEHGKHARSAVGMVSLPFGIAVEIEMIVEIDLHC